MRQPGPSLPSWEGGEGIQRGSEYCVTFFIILLFCHFTLVLSKVFDYN
jgi:hypothetical protein